MLKINVWILYFQILFKLFHAKMKLTSLLQINMGSNNMLNSENDSNNEKQKKL